MMMLLRRTKMDRKIKRKMDQKKRKMDWKKRQKKSTQTMISASPRRTSSHIEKD